MGGYTLLRYLCVPVDAGLVYLLRHVSSSYLMIQTDDKNMALWPGLPYKS
jgi:hypothetical protein